MEIMIDSMFKDRDNYITNLGRPATFEERRLINWAFRYLGKVKAEEHLANKIAVKKEKEEKIVKVKNKEEVS
jgi:hypothetical protein